jgi:hypothetical protein
MPIPEVVPPERSAAASSDLTVEVQKPKPFVTTPGSSVLKQAASHRDSDTASFFLRHLTDPFPFLGQQTLNQRVVRPTPHDQS